MGFFGPYKFKSKSGKEYFIHFKETGKVRLYYFSKERVGALNDIPSGYEVSANDKTELPFLRKKAGPAKKQSGPKDQKDEKSVAVPAQ